jgi:quercetin dioxygenase-like cupin family protein
MARKFVASLAVLALLLGSGIGTIATRAQDTATGTVLGFTLEDGALPDAPSFVRLLRITLEPGAQSPLHTHPGPEFQLLESGTLRVLVDGSALIRRAPKDGVEQPVEAIPNKEETIVRRGDQIAFLPGTAMTFRNTGSKPATILAAVMLPAGPQRPPGLVWVERQPTEEELAGVTSEILGDGVAYALPTGPSFFNVETVTLAAGEALPASDVPVMYSLVSGVLEFSIDSGYVQVSRIAEPGPRPDSEVGTAVALGIGDAVYFPYGVTESTRAEVSGPATFYRVTVVDDPAVTDNPAPLTLSEDPATITIADTPAPEVTPTPVVTEDDAEATVEPGTIGPGATAVVSEAGVRVRDNPGTATNVITSLDAGVQVTITGPSQEVDGIVWWPIATTDGAVVGWIAADFLSLP